MLVQQMTRDVLQIERGGNEKYLRSLQEATDTFDQTLWALINGGQVPYLPGQTTVVPAAQSLALQSELQQIHSTWETFQFYLDIIVAEELGSPDFVVAMQAVERLSPDLVQQSDNVVRMYEFSSTQKVVRLQWVQALFFVVALALLVLGILVIQKSIMKPLHDLDEATERIGQGNLDSPVEISGPCELTSLADSLDAMRSQLKASKDELEMRVNQRTRELAALNEVTREISSQLEIKHVLRSVTDKARELLEGEVAFLCLLDEAGQTLSLEAISGPKVALSGAHVSAELLLASRILAGDEALICGDKECEGACGIIASPFRNSHIATPLIGGQCVIGALCVSSSKAAAFSDEAANLLTKLASSATIALENARLYQQAERIAILEERQRMAAEIHDGLAQILSYLELKSERVAQFVEDGHNKTAATELESIRDAIRQAGLEVRRSINNLQRNTPLRQSLQDRLTETVDKFTMAGSPLVNMVTNLKEPFIMLSDDAEQVQRVVQEAMQNIRRHAQAKQVTVCFKRRKQEFIVIVEDDGKGFDSKSLPTSGSGHFGLSIMRARADRIGGKITIYAKPGYGTRVTLTWPIQADDNYRQGNLKNERDRTTSSAIG